MSCWRTSRDTWPTRSHRAHLTTTRSKCSSASVHPATSSKRSSLRAGLTDRRSWREWAAVILLPLFGGFAFGVGWLVGLVLLWSSRLWTTRDKLIGTLIVPGGIATALHCRSAHSHHSTLQGVRNGQSVNRGGRSARPCTAPPVADQAQPRPRYRSRYSCSLSSPSRTAVYLARRARAKPSLVVASTL